MSVVLKPRDLHVTYVFASEILSELVQAVHESSNFRDITWFWKTRGLPTASALMILLANTAFERIFLFELLVSYPNVNQDLGHSF